MRQQRSWRRVSGRTARAPELPFKFEDQVATRRLLAETIADPAMTGVVARDDGHIFGFLLGATVLPPPTAFWASFLHPLSVRIPYEGFAATGASPAAVYREMYSALAPRWVR